MEEMMEEPGILTEKERGILLQKVGFLQEAFHELYEKEIACGSKNDLRTKNIKIIVSRLEKWKERGSITFRDEHYMKPAFGLFIEAINNLNPQEEELMKIFQRYSPRNA